MEAEAKFHGGSGLSVEADLTDVVDALVGILKLDIDDAGIETAWFRFGHS